MGGKAIELGYGRSHRDILPVQPHILCTFGERAAAGAGGLVADKHDEVAGVGGEAFEVVEDAAAGEHAAGGDDDAGASELVEAFGFGNGGVHLNIPGEEARPLVVGEGLVEFAGVDVAPVDLGDFGGHGAVDVYGDVGDVAGLLEFAEEEGDELDAGDSE